MQRRRWNTYCRLRTNVKQLCETIMRGNEMFKETNYAKTNDQQWYGVVPDFFGVRKTWTQCMFVLGLIRDQCSAVRAGRSAAPRPPMPDVASPRTAPRCCRLRTLRTTADSSHVSPWAATGNSQGRRNNDSRTLASSPEKTTQTWALGRLVGSTRRHPFSFFLQ